jgi:CRISPR system Cascade subunit CasE
VKKQKKWLADRAELRGFNVTTSLHENRNNDASAAYSFDVVHREIRKFRKREGRVVTISVATFEGVLVVSDAELFVQTLRSGLGRSKAYGCGLLTLVHAK